MQLSMPQNMNELMHAKVTSVVGTALLTTAVLCAYSFMVNAEGETLLMTAVQNLMSVF